MSKKNANKQRLDEEHHTGLSEPNPIMFTRPLQFMYFCTPVLMFQGGRHIGFVRGGRREWIHR